MLELAFTPLLRVKFLSKSLVHLNLEIGLSGTMYWEVSEDLWLGELMLLLGFNARMECKLKNAIGQA